MPAELFIATALCAATVAACVCYIRLHPPRTPALESAEALFTEAARGSGATCSRIRRPRWPYARLCVELSVDGAPCRVIVMEEAKYERAPAVVSLVQLRTRQTVVLEFEPSHACGPALVSWKGYASLRSKAFGPPREVAPGVLYRGPVEGAAPWLRFPLKAHAQRLRRGVDRIEIAPGRVRFVLEGFPRTREEAEEALEGFVRFTRDWSRTAAQPDAGLS